MSNLTTKLTSKAKLLNSEMKTLKPILPKPNSSVMTRVIEINAPTMPVCKCFICDERVFSSGVPLLQSTTQASNTDLPTKIGQLMGERFMVVVSVDDVLCRKCHALVNHVDKLESDLSVVKRSLRNHLKKKYGLSDDQFKETDNLVDNETETEYVVIQDGESEEDVEPLPKKPKPQTGRFRAIKPKPADSVQLLKCSSCNFITTQQDLLSCHRLVCNAMAYKCTMCDKKFDSQKMIRNHKMEAHLSKWICHFCNLSFKEEKKFTVHMNGHLGDSKRSKLESTIKENAFKCDYCEESFEALSQLQSHLVNHTNAVTFKCVRCDVGFQSKQELIEHVKTHEDAVVSEYIIPENSEGVEELSTIYSCPMCALNFLEEDLYVKHLGTHPELVATEREIGFLIDENQSNGEDKQEAEDFACPNCGEKKEDQDHLEMHRLTECVGEGRKSNAEGNETKTGEFQPKAGEEPSNIELNQLLNNSLSVQLVDGSVVFENATNDRDKKDNETNDKTVEDILENMFQVRDDEDKVKEESEITDLNELKENEGSKTYVCADCSFSTENLATLKQHFVEKHETFKCWICEKSYTMDELRIHLETEHSSAGNVGPSQAKIYPCVHCSLKFTNRRALHLHEVTHPENLVIECPDCGEKFARDKFLNEHRDSAHTVSHCRTCKKPFYNIKQLKSHEARHARSDKNQFNCTECDRVFQTPTGLRHHKAIHTGEFKFTCEFCGKGFVSRVRYEEHRASHTKEERYSCEICGKKFSFQATYWIHRKWHDNPTPYKCEYCGRLFKHSSLLSVHKRKHTGERPYGCQVCGQSFTVGNTLKRHLMLHTGIFPFTCAICEQGFSGKHKMAMHMSKVHNDNSMLEKQANKKPSEYKMVVKPEEPSEEINDSAADNQTWILTENDARGSQLLTIQTEGENIPCALLTDEMIEHISGNRIIPYDSIKTVEIIPYEKIKEGEKKSNSVELNESERISFGVVSDDDEFVQQNQVYSDNNSESTDNVLIQTAVNEESSLKDEDSRNDCASDNVAGQFVEEL